MDTIIDLMRTVAGDAACQAVGVSPDHNPATAAIAAVMLLNPVTNYLTRVVPGDQRGCDFRGRFDREDNSRNAGWGLAPGEGGCDYPQGCEEEGSDVFRCPFKE